MEWLWILLAGAGLLGGGYVAGCSMSQGGTQTTQVETKSEQNTDVRTTVMQGQVMIILNGPAGQVEYFNVNFKDITNMQISRTNFEKLVITNGKTNRLK